MQFQVKCCALQTLREKILTYLLFDSLHVLVAQAEMVADLVHQHMADDGAERVLAIGPIIEDRAAIEPDHVGLLPGLREDFALRQAAAAKEAEQIVVAFAFHLVERLVVRPVVDADDDARAQLAKSFRQGVERDLRHVLEFGESG